MTTYWKVTGENGESHHGGSGRWTKGRWRSVAGEIVPCVRGLHLCRRDDLILWLGPVIWEAEADGDVIDHGDKVVARKARVVRRLDTWNERTARLFAADCAEYALQFVKDADTRLTLKVVIHTVRAYAEGGATADELAAARSAARSAAESAAWSAESAAWSAARSARSAAESAAWSAESAAWSAESAERSAARSFFTDRLFSYLYPEGAA